MRTCTCTQYQHTIQHTQPSRKVISDQRNGERSKNKEGNVMIKSRGQTHSLFNMTYTARDFQQEHLLQRDMAWMNLSNIHSHTHIHTHTHTHTHTTALLPLKLTPYTRTRRPERRWREERREGGRGGTFFLGGGEHYVTATACLHIITAKMRLGSDSYAK